MLSYPANQLAGQTANQLTRQPATQQSTDQIKRMNEQTYQLAN